MAAIGPNVASLVPGMPSVSIRLLSCAAAMSSKLHQPASVHAASIVVALAMVVAPLAFAIVVSAQMGS